MRFEWKGYQPPATKVVPGVTTEQFELPGQTRQLATMRGSIFLVLFWPISYCSLVSVFRHPTKLDFFVFFKPCCGTHRTGTVLMRL